MIKKFLIATTAIVATGVAMEKMIDYAINYREDEKDDDEFVDIPEKEAYGSEPHDDFEEFKPFDDFTHENKFEAENSQEEFHMSEDESEYSFFNDVVDETAERIKDLGAKARGLVEGLDLPTVEIKVKRKGDK